MTPLKLSSFEQAQLGNQKALRSGEFSSFTYPTLSEWKVLRAHMLGMSRRAAARYQADFKLPERMTAYTPGETRRLLQEPEVMSWHEKVSKFTMPSEDSSGRELQAVVLVPCAKSKPWDECRVGLYGAYNRLRERRNSGELPYVYFVTISEPLGVVPEDMWGSFPMYDNPGLFKNESLRAGGLMTQDFLRIEGLGKKVIVPFDERAYDECISKLSEVIHAFIRNNSSVHSDVKWLSFVDNVTSDKSTHGDMLDRVSATNDVPHIHRYAKKEKPRTSPENFIFGILQNEMPK